MTWNKHSSLALRTALVTLTLGAAACHSTPAAPEPPFAALANVDHLIQPGERHFAHLWQITRGGENAEGYWNSSSDRLVLQRRFGEAQCDRIFVTGPEGLLPVSNGRGVTTCAYFMPGDGAVIFASTQAHHEDCPPRPDRATMGYVWPVYPEYDLWVHDLKSGAERRITYSWEYDAEATVSPRGDRIVFTSKRTGDLELWTCDLEGGDLLQVTDSFGYDGGAFFSHDGTQLVFRATEFTPEGSPAGTRSQYAELIAQNLIRPHALEIYVVGVDGTGRRKVTELGGANWAPYFFPDDRRILFSSNHHDTNVPAVEFDLFAIGVDGRDLERITTYQGFDSFPMFSPDGRYLVFGSNRGGSEAGETNLFVAQWQ